MNTHTLTFTHIRPPDGDKRNVKFKVSVIGIPIKYSQLLLFFYDIDEIVEEMY